jgi:hypothetical protein
MRPILIGVLLVFAPAALAQGVAGPVTTGRISRQSPAHYVSIQTQITTVGNGSYVGRVVWPYSSPARLVDVIVNQTSAGTGGTSFTLDVRNAAATSLLSTVATVTLASGAETITDAAGKLALPSGWTRPVLKADSTAGVVKGDVLRIFTAETGVYSPHPFFVATLVFEPLQ